MISIILPTLGDRISELKRLFDSLISQTYKNFEIILVSQGNFAKIENLIKNYELNIKHIRSNRKGLSVNRNIAINYVNGNIIVFSDDDAWYFEESLEIVKKEIKNKDVVCFQIFDPVNNEQYKNYNTHKSNVNRLQILKKSSIEICINLSRVKKEKLKFNEKFGLGTYVKSGEENIFLKRILDNGNKIHYVPIVFVYHRKKINTKLDKMFLKDKIKVFREIYGILLGTILFSLLILKNINKLKLN